MLPCSKVKKTYVLDTNVVLHDPLAVYKFEDNTVVLPIFVIEEVDQFKKELSELGQNARHLSRILDDLRSQNGHTLDRGVPLESTGGELRVAVPPQMPTRTRSHGEMDRFILQMALDLRDAEPVRSYLQLLFAFEVELTVKHQPRDQDHPAVDKYIDLTVGYAGF